LGTKTRTEITENYPYDQVVASETRYSVVTDRQIVRTSRTRGKNTKSRIYKADELLSVKCLVLKTEACNK
jgi:hypothetical protein